MNAKQKELRHEDYLDHILVAIKLARNYVEAAALFATVRTVSDCALLDRLLGVAAAEQECAEIG